MQSACSTSAPAPRSRCFSTTLDYSRCRFPLAAVRTPSSNTSRTSRVSDAVHRHARLVPCARGGGAGGPERAGDRRSSTQEGRGRPGPRRLETREIVQLALPAVGLVALASVVAPLVAGLVVSTLAISAAAVAAAVALSLTWTLAPLFIGLFGLPLLIFGGFFAGVKSTAAPQLAGARPTPRPRSRCSACARRCFQLFHRLDVQDYLSFPASSSWPCWAERCGWDQAWPEHCCLGLGRRSRTLLVAPSIQRLPS